MSTRVEQRLREILRERREGCTPRRPRTTIAEARRPTTSAKAAASPPKLREGGRHEGVGTASRDARLRAIAETLGGDVIERDGGVAIVVDRFYPAIISTAYSALATWRAARWPWRRIVPAWRRAGIARPRAAPAGLRRSRDDRAGGRSGDCTRFSSGARSSSRTGSASGSIFLPAYQHERHQLAEVEALIGTSAGLVSYNGKSFDVPVLETRYQFNRLTPPFGGVSHVDMVHPARRFWRGVGASPGAWPESDSCRLSVLERTLFGVRRIGDVPGHEIPGRYFAFMRSGDASPLEPVLEHNRLDLISLAALTARAVRLLAGAPGSSTSARESLGAGRLLERADRLEDAESCYRDAAERARYERGSDVGRDTRGCVARAGGAVPARRPSRSGRRCLAGDRRRSARAGRHQARGARSAGDPFRASYARPGSGTPVRAAIAGRACGTADDGARPSPVGAAGKETGAGAGS